VAPRYVYSNRVYSFSEVGKFLYDSALTTQSIRYENILGRIWVRLIGLEAKYLALTSGSPDNSDMLLRDFARNQLVSIQLLVDDLWYVFYLHMRNDLPGESPVLSTSSGIRALVFYFCETRTGLSLRRRLRELAN